MLRTSRAAVVLAILLAVQSVPAAVGAPVRAADPGAPVLVTAPAISGTPRVGSTLVVDPGTWAPAAGSYRFTWKRDGALINTTTTPTRTLTVNDRGHTITAEVVALNEAGSSAPAPTAATPVVTPGPLVPVRKVSISGVRRWDHRLTANPGTTVPDAASVSYRWYRDGTAIAGATRRTRFLTVADFGHRIEVRVTARRAGWLATVRSSGETGIIGHRVPVRRTFTYSIATRGAISADVRAFARLAARSYADPRGWRAAGFAFVQVPRGGDFRLYLASAGTLPGFGYPCSAMWSCRVGNSVVINQTRWLHASPAWNAAGLSLRNYRHMVVNHETGHWLGHRHARCGGAGQPAPIMMQQSKGRDGCRFNPFPLPRERWTSR